MTDRRTDGRQYIRAIAYTLSLRKNHKTLWIHSIVSSQSVKWSYWCRLIWAARSVFASVAVKTSSKSMLKQGRYDRQI